jgi:hypothetical protein
MNRQSRAATKRGIRASWSARRRQRNNFRGGGQHPTHQAGSMTKPEDLQHFLDAQDRVYPQVQAESTAGAKAGCPLR